MAGVVDQQDLRTRNEFRPVLGMGLVDGLLIDTSRNQEGDGDACQLLFGERGLAAPHLEDLA